MECPPVGRHALLHPGGDHLHNVAAAESDALPHQSESPPFGLHLFSQAFELGGSCDERGEIKPEGLLYLTPLPFPRIALAVWAVPADQEATFDERRQLAPERRRRHAVRPQGELHIGRKHDEIPIPRESSLGVEGQQRVQHRQARGRKCRSPPYLRRSRGRPAICGRQSPAGRLSQPPDLPPWQATAFAARRASLRDVVP